MKQLFKQEILYGIYSRTYVYIIIFLVSLFALVSFVNYMAVITTYKDFLETENYYIENDLDVEAALAGEFDVKENGKVDIVENPLLYNKEMLSTYIYTLSPKYAFTQLLEASFLYFPIVFGMIGLLVGNFDYKYKTIKLKTVRGSKLKFGLTKQLSLLFSGFIILLISLMIAYLINYIFYLKMTGMLPMKEFQISLSKVSPSSSILIKFIMAYVVSIIFMVTGYTFGVIFKNMYVGFIIIVVYTLILPGGLSVFDVKNSLHYLGKLIFDFYGVLDLDHAKSGTTLLSSILVLLGAIVLPLAVNLVIIKRRSSFET